MPHKYQHSHMDPLWYKDTIIYELHVKSFYDSSGDGIGDIQGLIEKLDYFESLGISAIWLLPFYPSPLRDDGYDISDYFSVNPDYGTLRDFKKFLREAHKRDIRVITELVINHTSDQHPWFQRARHAKPGSIWRDYYVWNDDPELYKEARIIFKDFESSNWSWDPVAKAYYWHRFYSHQPDLNFENARVQKEIFRILDFWFGMGVDGLRLDAVPYLYERDGTNCENLPETHEFLSKLRKYVDSKYKNRFLLAEANQWPEDAAAYFGKGDECHMAFHFPVMPRLFMAFRMEDRFPIIDILDQTPEIPDVCQWVMFLRNHDELTLEMVTDEERDYMYRVFAQDPRARINLGIRRRLAPLLDNNRKKIELMNILLFSLPGTPVIYYGDEIGMGDNYYLGDRDGVRTPMQWSADRNAGFSKTNPQRLFLPVIIDPEYHFEALNVETQERNSSSRLWWMKRVIAMRKRFKAFSRGTLQFLYPDNPKVLTFIRQYEEEIILVVINLSRFTQFVEIDLSDYAGYSPEEVFSNNKFPIIKEGHYFLSLGPYGHYWLLLEKEKEQIKTTVDIPTLKTREKWTKILEPRSKNKLESILPHYLLTKRWFGGKSRRIKKVFIADDIPLSKKDQGHVLFLNVEYITGSPDHYVLPVAYVDETQGKELTEQHPECVIAPMIVGGADGFLIDALFHQDFRQELLQHILNKRKIKGKRGELFSHQPTRLRLLAKNNNLDLSSNVLKAEQSNSAVVYEDKFFLKLYRKIDEGINPDAEVVEFLTHSTQKLNVPPFAGSLHYQQAGKHPFSLTLLQEYVQNEGDAWTITLYAIGQYFERVLSKSPDIKPEIDIESIFDVDISQIPSNMIELIGGIYLEQTSLLGKRTGEMHLALARSNQNPDFSPEPFSTLYLRSLYQSLRSKALRGLLTLEKNISNLPEHVQQDAMNILHSKPEIMRQFRRILNKKISGLKIRIHGDFHLGQVLFTGKDFVIIDFEGEPARPYSERRLKYSNFRDVAGMIRSFHYALFSALFQKSTIRQEDMSRLQEWIEPWFHYVSGVFLSSYFDTVSDADFIPNEKRDIQILLQAFMLEKALYEIGYEIDNRPDWVVIPIKGIKMIIENSLID